MELLENENGPLADVQNNTITVVDRTGALTRYDVPKASGDHGGGDDLLHDRLFGALPPPDPLGHMAGSWAGAMSVLIGVAANRSIASGEPVRIGDLLRMP